MLVKRKYNYSYIKVYTEEVISKYLDSSDERVKKKFKWLLNDIARVLDRNKSIVDEILTKQEESVIVKEGINDADGIIDLVKNTMVNLAE